MFDGKMSDFRGEGGIVKTEEEKRQMAEKHRFKKEREFKKRLDEQEENEDGDIRSFKFHSLEKKEFKRPREAREPRESRGSRDSRDSRNSRDSRGSRDFRDSRDFKKPFKKNNRRFRDDDED
jgi:putative N6-adenine-specific DNA methylase